MKSVFRAAHKLFPYTSVLRCAWKVKLPFFKFLHKQGSQYLLVPVQNVVREFFFSSNEVGGIVRPNSARTPRRSTNLSIPKTQLLVSINSRYYFEVDSASIKASKNESPSFFRRPLNRNIKRSKVIDPVLGNGGGLNASLPCRTSAIISVNVSAVRLRHVTHFNWIDLNVSRSFRFEKFCCVRAFKYSTPSWQCLSCRCFRNKRTNGCRASSVTRCSVRNVANCSNWVRPFARSKPFGPLKGDSFNFVEVLLIGEDFSKIFLLGRMIRPGRAGTVSVERLLTLLDQRTTQFWSGYKQTGALNAKCTLQCAEVSRTSFTSAAQKLMQS